MSYGDRERIQSEDRDVRVPEIRRFELTAALSATESNNAKVLQWSRTDEDTALGQPFKVYPGTDEAEGQSGDQGYAVYMRDARRWEAITILPGIRIAVLDGDLAHGGSATASVYTANAGSESDSGENVTVYDFDHIGSGKEIVSGTKVFIGNVNGYWYVINAAACGTTA